MPIQAGRLKNGFWRSIEGSLAAGVDANGSCPCSFRGGNLRSIPQTKSLTNRLFRESGKKKILLDRLFCLANWNSSVVSCPNAVFVTLGIGTILDRPVFTVDGQVSATGSRKKTAA